MLIISNTNRNIPPVLVDEEKNSLIDETGNTILAEDF